MIKKIFQTILAFTFLFMAYKLFIKGWDEIPAKELIMDSLVVGTFTSLLLWFFAYFSARKNLIKNGIDPKDFQWETNYSVIIKNMHCNRDQIQKQIQKLGFEFVKQQDNKLIYKSKMSFWSWGEVIEVDMDNFKIRSFSVNPLAIADLGQNRINVERIVKNLIY